MPLAPLLTEPEKATFMAHHSHGMCSEKLGRLLERHHTAVKKNLRRARKKQARKPRKMTTRVMSETANILFKLYYAQIKLQTL